MSDNKKNRQEENWKLMTVLQIPWHLANEIEDEDDRKFLLEKAVEVEGFLQQQQQMHQQMQKGQAGEPQQCEVPPSPIIAPN